MTLSNSSIQKWLTLAIQQKRNDKEIIMKDNVWEVTMYLDSMKPTIKFTVRCKYKSGIQGVTTVVFKQNGFGLEELLLYRTIPREIEIRKDIRRKMIEVADLFLKVLT